MSTTRSQERCPFRSPRDLFHDFVEVRGQDGLVYSKELHGWVLSRYDDIIQVLDQPDLFSSRPTVPDPPPQAQEMFRDKVPLRGTLIGIDNPDHDRLKLSVSSFFVPRRLQRFEPLIRKLANELIDEFVNLGTVNIKLHFALPLPLKTIAAVGLAFFGGHPDLATGSHEEKLQALFDLHAHCAELIQMRRDDRRDDLIMVMTDFKHLSMLPGLMLAGHETTTNLLSMGLAHLLHTGTYEKAQEDDASRAAALEELFRFESAITGMPRLVTKECTLAGQPLHEGDHLFVAYNSGSRDEKYFPRGDNLELHRMTTKQHLGFGRGVHACLGAPLARLLLRTELSVIKERLTDLRFVTPYSELEYLPIGEGRGLENLQVGWDLSQVTAKPLPQATTTRAWVSKVAKDIICFTLRAPSSEELPPWTPGSHIDIQVGELGWRQYSLCSSSSNNESWEISVLLESHGSGGSAFLHSTAFEGTDFLTRGPRNHFPLAEADQYIFIAGGIGITPIRLMLHDVKERGSQHHVYYLGSNRDSMAFVNEIEQLGTNATIHSSAELGRLDLSFLSKVDAATTKIYCCGPPQLNSAVEAICSTLPVGVLRVEKFVNDVILGSNMVNRLVEVKLARSGMVILVPPEKSILEVLNEQGAGIISTCQKGTCGTCEVQVLEGIPEHRDTVLTKEEKAQNRSMMVCVSRCMGSSLLLDF
ncbi:cytochrome P450 [Rhexocercosporidium sp. MPI-PUGE-AT-0058]|nr:cytochrome P450 [Rhexocercosporidium sp. MPI-PUGE-AT-0058]